MALNTILLQAPVSGTFDFIGSGVGIIGTLLMLILALITYIWQDNKKRDQEKHQDVLRVIDKIDMRVNKVEDLQQKQAFQMVALNTAINVIQGKPIDYDHLEPIK